MDTTVTGIGSVVVAELRTAGYMESTIGQYEKSIKALARFAGDHGGVYTPAVGVAFASMTVSPRTGRFSAQRRFDYRRLVGVFDAYVLTGRVVSPELARISRSAPARSVTSWTNWRSPSAPSDTSQPPRRRRCPTCTAGAGVAAQAHCMGQGDSQKPCLCRRSSKTRPPALVEN